MENITRKSSTGLDENVAGLICYLGTIVTGIIFFLIEKDSRFVRFHALQSLIAFGALGVLWMILSRIPFLGWIFSIMIWLVYVALWIIMMYKAYQGEMFKLPIVGDIAEKNATPSSAL